MLRARRGVFFLVVLALSWALISCTSFYRQTGKTPPASSIRGCHFASCSTISPQIASLAEAYTFYCYGELFGLQGKCDKSLQEFEKASARLPESGYINFEEGRLLLESDRLKEAIGKLDAAIAKSPGMARAYVLRGDANRMLFNIDSAIEDYRRGAALGFDEPTLRFTIAELLKLSRRYDEAIVELKRLKEIEPGSLRADFSLGGLYMTIGEPAKAVPCFERVVAAHPDDTNTISRLLEAYQQCGRFDEAIALGSKMVDRLPNDTQLRLCLANCMERAGRIDEAIKQLKILIKFDPHYAAALNYLGYIYIDRGLKLERGIALVRAALAIEPNNSAFLDSLGWGFYKQGNIKGAVQFLERAVAGLKEASSEPVICGHLALAYQKSGRLKDAKKYFAIVASAKSKDPAVQKLLRELSLSVELPKREDPTSKPENASVR